MPTQIMYTPRDNEVAPVVIATDNFVTHHRDGVPLRSSFRVTVPEAQQLIKELIRVVGMARIDELGEVLDEEDEG